MRRDTTKGRDGDYLVSCERSGFTVWASETVKQWDGLRVYKGFAEPRHPQDYIRARRENMTVPDARPEPTPVFIGPLITETTSDAAAGDTTLDVVATARFMPGDRIGLYLATGDLYRAIVFTVDSSTALTLVEALPAAVPSGGKVINFSAVAT